MIREDLEVWALVRGRVLRVPVVERQVGPQAHTLVTSNST